MFLSTVTGASANLNTTVGCPQGLIVAESLKTTTRPMTTTVLPVTGVTGQQGERGHTGATVCQMLIVFACEDQSLADRLTSSFLKRDC